MLGELLGEMALNIVGDVVSDVAPFALEAGAEIAQKGIDFAIDKYKLVNFLKDWPEDAIDKFYSDAYTDHYLADIAKEAYVIHDGEQFTEWKEYCRLHPEFTQPKK